MIKKELRKKMIQFRDRIARLEKERRKITEKAKKAKTPEEKEMFHNQLLDNESEMNIIKEEMEIAAKK